MELNSHIIKELRLKGEQELKASLPVYPIVRREGIGKDIIFSTLVRKRYDGVYYLIPMNFKGESEAKAIHGLHSIVYKYLMLGEQSLLDVEDKDQTNEVTRLKNL